MKKRIFFYSIIAAITISCTRQEQPTQTIRVIGVNDSIITINLDQDPEKELCYESSFFSKATPIVLEAHDKALLGDVHKIDTYDNYIFVLDRRLAKSVFVFDKTGKFIRQIGKRGNGPGEYIEAGDFTIDEDNQQVYIFDDSKNVIYCYNMSDGKFVKTINIQDKNVRSFYIQWIDGKLYADANPVTSSSQNYLLREIDPNTEEQTGCWLDTEEYNIGFDWLVAGNLVPQNPFYRLPYSGVTFSTIFSDTIISIDNSGLKPLMVGKSKNFMSKGSLERYKKDDKIDYFALVKADETFSIKPVFETDDIICFTYNTEDSYRNVYYNKNTHCYKIETAVWDDIVYKIDLSNEKFGLNSDIMHADKGGIYRCVGEHSFDKLFDLIKNDEHNLPAAEIEKLKKLDADSNPVLFYYEYKITN